MTRLPPLLAGLGLLLSLSGLTGCGSGEPPAEDEASLVPANATGLAIWPGQSASRS